MFIYYCPIVGIVGEFKDYCDIWILFRFAIIWFGSSVFNFVLKRDLLQIFPCIFRPTACDLYSVRPKCPQMDKILLHQNRYINKWENIYFHFSIKCMAGSFTSFGSKQIASAMITVMIKIFYVWPSGIEGGVDKGTPMEEKCLDEKILKKLGRNKSCQF